MIIVLNFNKKFYFLKMFLGCFSRLEDITTIFEEMSLLLILHPLVYFGFSTAVISASLFGNSVIIYIIRTENTMKTATNKLIINQTCADLLISLVDIMGVFCYKSTGSAWIGEILSLIFCKMFIAILFISASFSAWILGIIIALDRFHAITRPSRLATISQQLNNNNFPVLGMVNFLLLKLPC